MTYPAPFSLLYFWFYGHLLCSGPQVSVGDDFWPSDVEDGSETSVDECLQFVGVGFGCMPGL